MPKKKDLAFLNFAEHTVVARGFKICRLSWRHGEIYLRIFEFENPTMTFWIPLLRLFWIPGEFCLRQLNYWKESFEFFGNSNYVFRNHLPPFCNSANRNVTTRDVRVNTFPKSFVTPLLPRLPGSNLDFWNPVPGRGRGDIIYVFRLNAFRNLL